MKSEFGKGLCYCLGLFLCHSERTSLFSKEIRENMNSDPNLKRTEESWDDHDAELWFNGASDHFYDLQIPEDLPKSIQKRLKILADRALRWGHGFMMGNCKAKDKQWAIQEAKDLLRLIDKFHGVKTQKGQWE